MSQKTTAGRLLESLRDESSAMCDAVMHAAALPPERADGAMAGSLRLTLSEQLRLAEATITTAPEFRRDALRLRGQVLAARSFEAQELVERHRDPPVQRWEGSSQVRR